jgi:HemK-like putative methylase
MPRLPRPLITKAWNQHPLLPYLLRTCRDLKSSKLELKWLHEHVIEERAQISGRSNHSWQSRLRELCLARGRGVPLQYLLGTEYFGDLHLRCTPGVLIPRPATAAAVLNLLEWLKLGKAGLPSNINVLDMCTGSGCISLLFGYSFPYEEISIEKLTILGVDIASEAIRLAKSNRSRILKQLCSESHQMVNDLAVQAIARTKFIQSDISSPDTLLPDLNRTKWDIVISNPPYISPKSFRTTTSHSVRTFEPKLALVPPTRASLNDEAQGDVFYPRLLEIAERGRARVLLMEVADMEQANRVAEMAKATDVWGGVEIWRDDPRARGSCETVLGNVNVVGGGDGRSVFCWRKKADT